MKIYVYGSMAYDRIMDFPGYFAEHILPDKIHILNVCFTVNGMVEKFGGTAGNIAHTLSLLGERPTIIATIGRDYDRYFSWLAGKGLSTEGIRIIEEEFTAGAYITTDRADNQITGFNPGAMKHCATHEIVTSEREGTMMLIAPANLGDMARYAETCRRHGIPFICDPGQSLTAWEGEALAQWIIGSKILISNDYELELIMNKTGRDKESLMGLTEMIITTLGEKGSLVSSRKGDLRIPAVKAGRIVDPTGAGDAYRAGLLKGFAEGRHIETSARMGSVAAAYAVENYGTQEHSFSVEDFLARYRETFGPL
jgi:adenosine kinase